MARKREIWKFDGDAWIRDTRALSLEARAIWMDLLTEMWRSDRRGYLADRHGSPWTPERIAALCGCSAAVVTRVLQELLSTGVASHTDAGVLYCRRLVREERKRVKCSKAGKQGGGNPTLKDRLTSQSAFDTADCDDSPLSRRSTYKGECKGGCKGASKGGCKGQGSCQPELFAGNILADAAAAAGVAEWSSPPPPSPPPFSPPTPPSISPTTSTPSQENTHNAQARVWERFDAFWTQYPKRVAKQDAKRAWERLRPDDALLAVLLAALAQHKTSEQWQRGIIPNPATWLNGRRWEDEMPSPQAAGGMDAKLARLFAEEEHGRSLPDVGATVRPDVRPPDGR